MGLTQTVCVTILMVPGLMVPGLAPFKRNMLEVVFVITPTAVGKSAPGKLF